ncbi:MAG: sigma-70 family RNA polymerase sigma factor [Sediminibacterium sp.]|nr:MAG: sigma-70 family RNA polymerase sigma factor [Sediminibacterium sp.] [Sediminibacterium sp. FEMGT703S]
MMSDDLIKAELSLENSKVLEQVYRENKGIFMAFAKRYDLPDEDIIDIYQDAIVALVEHAKKGKLSQLNCAISTYLIGIGKFMLLNHLKKKRILFVPFDIELNIEWDDLEHIHKEQQVQLLQTYFLKLGSHCQKILEMFYYREKKLDDIVIALGYDNKDVVKSQKSRCIKQLRELIETNHG